MAKKPLPRVFADPKMDLPFKKLFGTREHQRLLIELLNALLRLPEAERIVSLEYLSPEQLPPHDGLKLSILDVKCTDARDTRYVVEMQVLPVDGFEKRVVLNACKSYVEQLESGSAYDQLSDVIAVTICNFTLWDEKVKMLSRWRMQEEETGARGLQHIQYVFLELPKYQAGSAPRTLVDKWAYFFREAWQEHEIPAALAQEPWQEALEAVERVNFSQEEWTDYQRSKMAEQDQRGALTYAQRVGHQLGLEQGEKRGEKRGQKKGLKEGLEKGQKLGLEKGLEQGQKLGLERGLREAIKTACELLDIPLTAKRQRQLEPLLPDALAQLLAALKQQRAWPASW